MQQRIVPVLAAICLLLAAGAGLPLARGNPVALTIMLALAVLLLALVVISWRQADRALTRQRSDRARIARLEAEKADLEIFVNAATHDLHEPLRKIQVFGDRLRDQLGLLPDPALAQPLDRMTAAAGVEPDQRAHGCGDASLDAGDIQLGTTIVCKRCDHAAKPAVSDQR